MFSKVASTAFDVILVLLGCVDITLAILTVLLFSGNPAAVNAMSWHAALTTKTVITEQYYDDVSADAFDAMYYSSKIGIADNGIRKSTVDCYKYVGDNIKIVDKYSNSLGEVTVVSPNEEDLYIVVEEDFDSFVFKSSCSYDTYRSKR